MKKFLKFIILGAIVIFAGAVAAAYFLGILDWQTTKTQFRIKASEATSEIGSALDSLEAPAPPHIDQAKAAEQCRANLRRIESAKRSVAAKRGITVGVVPRDAIVQELGGTMPVCPAGGTYEMGTLEVTARCSIGGNISNPANDHLIRGF